MGRGGKDKRLGGSQKGRFGLLHLLGIDSQFFSNLLYSIIPIPIFIKCTKTVDLTPELDFIKFWHLYFSNNHPSIPHFSLNAYAQKFVLCGEQVS
jgi:hypothetical protein